MRTRSSSNLPGESSPNPTSSNPKLRNCRRSKQPFILEESLVDTMADQCTMAELLRAPIEGYAKAILAWDQYKYLLRACPHHGFTELHQLDTFYNALNPADQDSLNYAAGGNLLERRTQDVLTIIETNLRDPRHPNIPYPSRMHKQKQQEKDEVQIHKFWQIFKQLHINITLTDALILIPKYQKMLKALLSNKEKLLELANTPLNENCSAVILKKLPEKLKDPGKFFIPCGFSLPELISTRMTLELANRAICTPAEIARGVFVSVGKFTFPADFFIIDYESDPRAPFILGRPFLWTVRALIDVHGEEMILRDGDERLTLNMRHDTCSYLSQPQKESINMINIYDDSCEDFLEDLFATNHQSGNPTFSYPNLTSPEVKDDIYEPEEDMEFADELALIIFPPGNDDLPFDIESDLKEIEYLLYHDPIKKMDYILKDSVDEENLADLNDNLVDTIPEMFTDEHALDYSSIHYTMNMMMIFLNDFPPSPEYDSFLFEDFSKVSTLPSTSNEDKVFNPGILIQENLYEVITHVVPDKNVKKIAISHASLILEDFDPPLYELSFHKEVLGSETLLSFLSKNEEKVFKPEILASKGVHSSLLPKLSHRGHKVFKILESPMEIFPCFYGEDIRILNVPCLYFYPPLTNQFGG
uniref:Reverse transcriptase domain-containing protein n=1 Tax=Tanacetum cinerariifolium TaxID=118510 RepID=A0A699GJJ2_TANCI|nr:reverse transcriptase domain-containing protein [Tanacetum cinerariifolium]